ncbi:MAG: pyridoxal phosphate-dependent aminotransferase [Flavobacterium sp.]
MITTATRLHQVQEYYFSTKLKEVQQLVASGKPVINMGIGSPDMPPAPQVIESLYKAMSEPKAHEYQSYQGLPELRAAMKRFYGNHYNIKEELPIQFLPLMGSKEGILHVSMAFLNPGDEVLIPNPGYPTYTSVTHLVQACPVFYDLNEKQNWEPDFEALEQMDLSKVKLMWVSYPHMPTGTKGNLNLFKKLVAFAQKHHIILVNDNPYSFVLNEQPESIFQVPGGDNVCMELNSLSKTFNMAGWRVGMISGKEEFINAVLKVKSNMDSGMFYGIQKGAITALHMGKEWFEEMNEVYKKRRVLIWELADRLGCTFQEDTAGLFVWAKLPEGEKAEPKVDEILYNKHVFITPGTVFGTNGEGYLRFSLCVTEENIVQAIQRMNS